MKFVIDDEEEMRMLFFFSRSNPVRELNDDEYFSLSCDIWSGLLATNSSESFSEYSMWSFASFRHWFIEFVSRIWVFSFGEILFVCVEYLTRYCSSTGKWSAPSFTSCFYPDVLALLKKSYTRRPSAEREVRRFKINSIDWFIQVFEKIVRILRYLELASLSISLTSILISLFIFFTFK